jgi:hypothetical protein
MKMGKAMANIIGRILCSSIKNLFDNQPTIFEFTSETGETEWNLACHLSHEIRKYIFWLDNDVELTKATIIKDRILFFINEEFMP